MRMTLQETLALLISIAVIFYFIWPKPNRPKTARSQQHIPPLMPVKEDAPVPANAIVVDGSNVMFWGGEPSANVLARVIKQLENAGLAPIVIFDASAGYRLSDRYMNEHKLARLINMAADRTYVVHKGVVADEVILDFATEHDLRVVTNDRYKDWTAQFPLVKQKGRLVKGVFKEGSVMFQGL